jgi:hypothetical protein
MAGQLFEHFPRGKLLQADDAAAHAAESRVLGGRDSQISVSCDLGGGGLPHFIDGPQEVAGSAGVFGPEQEGL